MYTGELGAGVLPSSFSGSVDDIPSGWPFLSLAVERGQRIQDTEKYILTANVQAVLDCQGLSHPHLLSSFILQRGEQDHWVHCSFLSSHCRGFSLCILILDTPLVPRPGVREWSHSREYENCCTLRMCANLSFHVGCHYTLCPMPRCHFCGRSFTAPASPFPSPLSSLPIWRQQFLTTCLLSYLYQERVSTRTFLVSVGFDSIHTAGSKVRFFFTHQKIPWRNQKPLKVASTWTIPSSWLFFFFWGVHSRTESKVERFLIISSDLGSKTNSRLSRDICSRKRTMEWGGGGGVGIEAYCLWTWELPHGIF